MTDCTHVIQAAAAALNGQAVVLNLVGGQSLTGTLTYATMPGHHTLIYPDALTVDVSGKAHTVRLDHVSSIGEG